MPSCFRFFNLSKNIWTLVTPEQSSDWERVWQKMRGTVVALSIDEATVTADDVEYKTMLTSSEVILLCRAPAQLIKIYRKLCTKFYFKSNDTYAHTREKMLEYKEESSQVE